MGRTLKTIPLINQSRVLDQRVVLQPLVSAIRCLLGFIPILLRLVLEAEILTYRRDIDDLMRHVVGVGFLIKLAWVLELLLSLGVLLAAAALSDLTWLRGLWPEALTRASAYVRLHHRDNLVLEDVKVAILGALEALPFRRFRLFQLDLLRRGADSDFLAAFIDGVAFWVFDADTGPRHILLDRYYTSFLRR